MGSRHAVENAEEALSMSKRRVCLTSKEYKREGPDLSRAADGTIDRGFSR
jgi:hypothetical protein